MLVVLETTIGLSGHDMDAQMPQHLVRPSQGIEPFFQSLLTAEIERLDVPVFEPVSNWLADEVLCQLIYDLLPFRI